jgi:membrane protease subunit HflC
MRRLLLLILVVGGGCVGLVSAARIDLGPLVITREGEQKIIFRFSEARKVTEPGWALRWGIPVVERVETYDSRWIYLNTEPLPIQTRDGERLKVDNYVIWRIDDAVAFRRAFRGRMSDAADRIDKTVRDGVREVVGRHTLAEVLKDERRSLMEEISRNSRAELQREGIEVADVRINRTELPEGAEASVFARMEAERERLAKKNRAEGEERARSIRAQADREGRVIVAEAKRDAEIARGEGDAAATRIYAEAYGEAPEFYAFLRSLEAYRKTIDARTTLVLSPDSEFFQFLQGTEPKR